MLPRPSKKIDPRNIVAIMIGDLDRGGHGGRGFGWQPRGAGSYPGMGASRPFQVFLTHLMILVAWMPV
jgi:hypothetical protein